MKHRVTRLILAGAAALSIGAGATALSSNHPADSPSGLKQAGAPTGAKAHQPTVLLSSRTLGSYFWDTGDSGNGDTGAPASGLPMREGCFASPSWPMGTKGYIVYQGKHADFVICDRGPGIPSRNGVMIDIDGITYAKLTGGTWNVPYVVGGNGTDGHIPITYYVTKWGDGPGKGVPQPL